MTEKVGMAFAFGLSVLLAQPGEPLIEAPRFWNDRDLQEWATPVSGLNVRPGHYSEKEYYSAPVGEYVRTYPVFFQTGSQMGTGISSETRSPNR